MLVIDGLRARIQQLNDEKLIQEIALPYPAIDAEISRDGLSVAIAIGSAIYRWNLQDNALLPAGNWKRRVIKTIGMADNDVVSGLADGDLLLTAINGQALHEAPSRQGGVSGVKSTLLFIAAAYKDGVDILTPTLEVMTELSFQAVAVCAMPVSPDASLLGIATGSVLYICNTRTWAVLRTVHASSFYTNDICALAFVSNSKFVAAFSDEPREFSSNKPEPSIVNSHNPEGGQPLF